MYSRILVVILAVAVGAGVGAFTAVRMTSDASSSKDYSKRVADTLAERLTAGEASALDSEQVALVVDSLMQILDEEISERQILAEQLEDVQSEMADLQQNLRARVEAAFSESRENAIAQRAVTQVNQSMEERLAASGFTPQQFEVLRRREEGAQMQQIELNDQAIRSGRVCTPMAPRGMMICISSPSRTISMTTDVPIWPALRSWTSCADEKTRSPP